MCSVVITPILIQHAECSRQAGHRRKFCYRLTRFLSQSFASSDKSPRDSVIPQPFVARFWWQDWMEQRNDGLRTAGNPSSYGNRGARGRETGTQALQMRKTQNGEKK